MGGEQCGVWRHHTLREPKTSVQAVAAAAGEKTHREWRLNQAPPPLPKKLCALLLLTEPPCTPPPKNKTHLQERAAVRGAQNLRRQRHLLACHEERLVVALRGPAAAAAGRISRPPGTHPQARHAVGWRWWWVGGQQQCACHGVVFCFGGGGGSCALLPATTHRVALPGQAPLEQEQQGVGQRLQVVPPGAGAAQVGVHAARAGTRAGGRGESAWRLGVRTQLHAAAGTVMRVRGKLPPPPPPSWPHAHLA